MNQVRRVLIYRLGSLGDTLIALPALHLVARAFPDAERRLLTNFPVNVKAPPAAAVLENTGLVHGFLRYTVGTRSPLDLARLWWQIASWRPDILVYLGAARGTASAQRDATFFRLCGIRRQVGVPITDPMQLNAFGAPTTSGLPDLEPEAARLARNIGELGDPALHDPASWSLHLTPAEHAAARAAIGPEALGPDTAPRALLAVSVGTKVQAKDWGVDNWRILLARLPADLPPHPSGWSLLLAGSPEESAASESAAQGWRAAGGGPVANLCGKLTPRQSAAAFAAARLFIGHDSGPMHLAAASQTPCVAIFAARNIPRVWFPFGNQHQVLYHPVPCMGCELETCIVERKKCILSITPDEVLSAVRQTLHLKQ